MQFLSNWHTKEVNARAIPQSIEFERVGKTLSYNCTKLDRKLCGYGQHPRALRIFLY